MYNGVEYAAHRTLISSHKPATGSHFISGTVENIQYKSYVRNNSKEKREHSISPPLALADVLKCCLPVLSYPHVRKKLHLRLVFSLFSVQFCAYIYLTQ